MEVPNQPNGYRVEAGFWQTEPVVILRNDNNGTQATIATGIGANCVAWSITKDGQRIEVLETPPSPQELRSRHFKAGIPILWPFPGRVREARYTFEGEEYHLPRTDKGGIHHIHGLVLTAPWHLTQQGTGQNQAFAEFTIRPADLTEEDRAGYPFNFELILRYTLAERSLTIDLGVENQGQSSLPFGYGLHPYFRAPLVVSEKTPDRSECLVMLPSSNRWPTVDGLPTGGPEAVKPAENFLSWRPLGSQLFDHMYGKIIYDGDWSLAGFRDPGAGLVVLVRADRHFEEWVLFTQPNRPSLSIEPYTCPPNSINLAAEGIAEDGLITLPPGDTWQTRTIIEVNDFNV